MRWLCSTVNATLSPDAIKAHVEALKLRLRAKDLEAPRSEPPLQAFAGVLTYYPGSCAGGLADAG